MIQEYFNKDKGQVEYLHCYRQTILSKSHVDRYQQSQATTDVNYIRSLPLTLTLVE